MKNKPHILRSSLVDKSQLFDVERYDLQFCSSETKTYERLLMKVPGFVLVVPMLDEETMVLIKEYLSGPQDYKLIFPKGTIDPGEDVMTAANRELREEIGYEAKNITLLKQVFINPVVLNHSFNLLLAQDLSPSSLKGDEPEKLERVRWRIDKSADLMAREDFSEGLSIAALYLAKEKLALKESR